MPLKKIICEVRLRLPVGLGLRRMYNSTGTCQIPKLAAQVLTFWKSEQPSKPLAHLASKLWCCCTSQGQAERYWALANRDRSAIRNRLAISTQSKLQAVATNMPLLISELQEPKAPSLSRCLCYTKLAASFTCGVQAIVGREVREIQDAFPADEEMSFASSSSTSSESEG